MTSIDTLAARVSKRRTALGLSQNRLAAKADVSLSTLTKIEGGFSRNPRGETLEKIATALGESVDYLITGKRPARRS